MFYPTKKKFLDYMIKERKLILYSNVFVNKNIYYIYIYVSDVVSYLQCLYNVITCEDMLQLCFCIRKVFYGYCKGSFVVVWGNTLFTALL